MTEYELMKAEIERLRAALRFYADEANYLDGVPGEWEEVGMGAAIDYYGDPGIQEFEADHGEHARAALAAALRTKQQ